MSRDTKKGVPLATEADRRTASRLFQELLTTMDADLSKFRKRRIGRESELDLEYLKQARQVLEVLGETLIRGDDDLWQGVRAAWQELWPSAMQPKAEPKAAPEPEASEPAAEVEAASEQKPSLADEAAAPPRPVPPRPPTPPATGENSESPWAPPEPAEPVPQADSDVGGGTVQALPAEALKAMAAVPFDSGGKPLTAPPPEAAEQAEPFNPEPSSEEPSSDEPVGSGTVQALPADALKAMAAVPFGDEQPAGPPLPELTVEQYAGLSVECNLYPGHLAQTLQRYGVPDEATRLQLDQVWQQRFAADPELKQRFTQARAAHEAWCGNPDAR